MAQQNKAQDAVAAAMSAIEEALNMSVADQASQAKQAEPSDEAKGAPAKPLPNIAAAPAPNTVTAAAPEIRTAEPRIMPSPIRPPRAESPRAREGPHLAPPPLPSPAETPPAPAPSALPNTPPANDDRASVGQLLMAFQSRPASRAPMMAAAAVALVWLLLCGAFLAQHYDLLGGGSLTSREFWLKPEIAQAALVVIAPAPPVAALSQPAADVVF
jgi:hypothetical protein